MRKIIITLVIILATTVCVWAGNKKIDPDVLEAFTSEFPGAASVNWTESSNYCKASFTQDRMVMFAYYSSAGRLLAVTRYISSTELPAKLQKEIRQVYSNYWIADLFEVKRPEGTSYYVTLQNGGTKIILESANGNSWEFFN